jgi:hypothetical protein
MARIPEFVMPTGRRNKPPSEAKFMPGSPIAEMPIVARVRMAKLSKGNRKMDRVYPEVVMT